MNYFINIYIFLTLLLSLSAFPYSKNFDINSIPIEENSLKNEKKISIPTIKDVSAMCSSGGDIHASIEFDQPFSGRIYSLGYGNVHECVFFNGYYTKRVLFTIPINNCGTHITHNTREVVDLIENRVYVQIDKFTLTTLDRKYAFVCELSANFNKKIITNSSILSTSKINEHEIRKHPIEQFNDLGNKKFFSVALMTPIIPQNLLTKYTTTSMPAMLFYGNQQWKIPSENINFKPINNNLLLKLKTDPTITIPFSEKNNTNFNCKNFTTLNIKLPKKENLTKQFLLTNFSDSNSVLNLTKIENNFNSIKINENKEKEKNNENNNQSSKFDTIIKPSNSQNQLNNTLNEITSFVAGISPISSELNKSIYLEIKRGVKDPLNSERINGSVRIGEPIMLIVHAKTMSKDINKYNIFVHSCYSSGGSGTTRIKLIDNLGCAIHPQVIGSMKRQHILLSNNNDNKFNAEIIYYFVMKAFKFPAGDDVHFFCSVDISPDYNFFELCSKSPRKVRHVESTKTNFLKALNNNLTKITSEKIIIKIKKPINFSFNFDEKINTTSATDKKTNNDSVTNVVKFTMLVLLFLTLFACIIRCIVMVRYDYLNWRDKYYPRYNSRYSQRTYPLFYRIY